MIYKRNPDRAWLDTDRIDVFLDMIYKIDVISRFAGVLGIFIIPIQ